MDKETIEEKRWRMLKILEAKAYPDDIGGTELLDQLIELATAEEREACAVIAEGEGHYMCEDAQDTAKGIADLIRSRSEP